MLTVHWLFKSFCSCCFYRTWCIRSMSFCIWESIHEIFEVSCENFAKDVHMCSFHLKCLLICVCLMSWIFITLRSCVCSTELQPHSQNLTIFWDKGWGKLFDWFQRSLRVVIWTHSCAGFIYCCKTGCVVGQSCV